MCCYESCHDRASIITAETPKNHENSAHLIHCLATWSSGDSLVQEDRVLQGNLKTKAKQDLKNDDNVSRRFSIFMFNGRVKDALYLLSEDNCGGILSLSPTVLKALSDKHPKRHPTLPTTLIGDSSNSAPLPHSIVFMNWMVFVSVVLLLKLEVQLDLLSLMLQHGTECVLHFNALLMISVRP